MRVLWNDSPGCLLPLFKGPSTDFTNRCENGSSLFACHITCGKVQLGCMAGKSNSGLLVGRDSGFMIGWDHWGTLQDDAKCVHFETIQLPSTIDGVKVAICLLTVPFLLFY